MHNVSGKMWYKLRKPLLKARLLNRKTAEERGISLFQVFIETLKEREMEPMAEIRRMIPARKSCLTNYLNRWHRRSYGKDSGKNTN